MTETKIPMKAWIRTKWLQMLRSGDYKQGSNWLNADGKFCCWGLLCEIAVEDGVVRREDNGDSLTGAGLMRYVWVADPEKGPSVGMPTNDILGWAGLHVPYPDVIGLVSHLVTHPSTTWTGTLDEMNDQGIPFAVIADIIEAVTEGVE